MSYKDPEKRKEWKRNNRDKVMAQQERYYKTEKGKAALKRASERAKERWKEYSVSPEVLEKKVAWEKKLAEWAATKKDRKRIASKRQRDAKRARDIASGKIIVRPKRTEEEKREVKAASRRNRKAMEKAAIGKLSHGIRKTLYAAQRGKCPVCQSALILEGWKKYHIDHVIPLSAGGTNTDDNVQLLCFDCNVSKGKKDPVIFMQSRGFLL